MVPSRELAHSANLGLYGKIGSRDVVGCARARWLALLFWCSSGSQARSRHQGCSPRMARSGLSGTSDLSALTASLGCAGPRDHASDSGLLSTIGSLGVCGVSLTARLALSCKGLRAGNGSNYIVGSPRCFCLAPSLGGSPLTARLAARFGLQHDRGSILRSGDARLRRLAHGAWYSLGVSTRC